MSSLFASRDPALINRFINDPAVLPYCGFPAGTTWADCTDRIADDDLVFVTDGEAAMMCLQRRAGVWEKHNLFRSGCRGRAAIVVGKAMLDWAWRTLGATVVVASTPSSNRAARWFNRQIGMKSLGVRPSAQFGFVEHFKKDIACL
jgi:hypothetical protein